MKPGLGHITISKRFLLLASFSLCIFIIALFIVLTIKANHSYPFRAQSQAKPYSQERKLIVTADDYGVADCINQGILTGVREGVINTLSALINFENAPAAIIAARQEFPDLAIGIHLNITSGKPVLPPGEITSLVNKDGYFYPLEDILLRLNKIDLKDVEKEVRAQIELFLKTGVKPDHLSYHHNLLAMYPPFLDITMAVAKEYGLPMRNPYAISVEDKESFGDAGTHKAAFRTGIGLFFRNPVKAIRLLRTINARTLKEDAEKIRMAGIPMPDHFIDYIYGNPSPYNLMMVMNNMPEGTSEIVFHLGIYCDPADIEKGIDKEYLPIRQQELMLVTSNYFKDYLKNMNVQLISFQDLNKHE
jgi:predicted glycoside hydrolase/deacetylase ChbG (UPF0249 family)